MHARGWCADHYWRWHQYGDPLATKKPTEDARRQARIDYLWANVERRGPDECWLWLRKPTNSGYGQMRGFHGHTGAHRFSYELHHGPIPEGMQVDHLCHEPTCTLRTRCTHRLCVNPAHLGIKTGASNRARGITARPGNGADLAARTHCPRGHAYDEENTGRTPNGGRRCRACAREKAMEKADRERPDRGLAARDRTHCPQGHPYDEENTSHKGGSRTCKTCARDRAREAYRAKHGGNPPGHANTRKTHCPQGHEYTPENTKVSKSGGRSCRECIRVANREYMRQKRAAARQ